MFSYVVGERNVSRVEKNVMKAAVMCGAPRGERTVQRIAQ